MAKASKATLPAGFKAISGGGDFADGWNFKKQPTLMGVLKNIRHWDRPAEGKKGSENFKPAESVPIYVIATKDGDVSVFHRAGLRALAEVKKGKQVYIHFDGLRKVKGRPQPMAIFTVASK